MNVVSVENLTRKFGDFTAVNEVSFHVEKGEIFGFLGANGAGKSTTIRMLCGILPPSSGKASLLGVDVIKDPYRIKQSIGYMSQKFSLYGDLTVGENIEFFGGIHKLTGRPLQEKKRSILEMSDLRGEENRLTKELPGGWKQKLALGCSMIHDPGVLFLDEPTAGVDPAARRVFWDMIHSLREKGTTIFVTSHYMDEVEECNRVAMMHRGRIAALDQPNDLKRETIPGTVLEIIMDTGSEQVRNLLEHRDDVASVDPFGSGYHLITKKKLSEQKTRSLCQELKEDATRLSQQKIEVKPVTPTLEDVFVYLIGSLDREADDASKN